MLVRWLMERTGKYSLTKRKIAFIMETTTNPNKSDLTGEGREKNPRPHRSIIT
jgi:hypothetical protein